MAGADRDRGNVPGPMPAVPLTPLRPRDPAELGPFRLLGRLGSGGMGVAFLAQAASGWVVVKQIRAELGDDAEFRTRLLRELAAMRAASGHGTAALVAEGLEDDPPWFAMEFVHGLTLARSIPETGPMPSQALVEFADALARVVGELHRCGVVHRDLKPSNVMLSPQGPKVIDFGIADLADGTQLTRTGTVLGSTGWLAPEQVRGDAATEATDVHAWALCVLYAATAVPPFGADTSSAALYRVLELTPSIPDTIPEPLRGLLVRALDKDPTRRPTVANIIDTTGNDFITSVPPPPGAPPAMNEPAARSATAGTEPLSASSRRTRWALTASVAAAVILLATGLVLVAGRSSVSEPAPDAVAATQTSATPVAATRTLDVGQGPCDATYGASTQEVFILACGDTQTSSSLVSVDPVTRQVQRQVDLGVGGQQVLPVGDGSTMAVLRGWNPRASSVTDSTNEVVLVNSADMTVIDRIRLSSSDTGKLLAGAMAVTADGGSAVVTTWDEDSGKGSLVVVDLAARQVVATWPTSRYPWAVAIGSDAKAYVAIQGTAEEPGSTVEVIDLATGTKTRTIRIGQYPTGVTASADASRIFVAYTGTPAKPGSGVSVIDVASAAVSAITVPANPWWLAVDDNSDRLVVTHVDWESKTPGSVSLIDLAASTPEVIGTAQAGVAPSGVAIDPATGTFVVTNAGTTTTPSTTVTFLSPDDFSAPAQDGSTVPQSASSTRVVDLPGAPGDLDASGDTGYVLISGTDDKPRKELAVVDLATAQVIKRIDLGARPYGLAVDHESATAYITSGDTGASYNYLEIVDLATGKSLKRVATTRSVGQVTITPDGNRVFFSNYFDSRVSTYDIRTGRLSDFTTSPYPDTLVVSSDGRYLVVLHTSKFASESEFRKNPANNISIIDTQTLKVLATTKVKVTPAGIAVSPDTSVAYVTANGPKVDSCEASEVLEVSLPDGALLRRWSVDYCPSGVATIGANRLLILFNPTSGYSLKVLDLSNGRANKVTDIPGTQGGWFLSPGSGPGPYLTATSGGSAGKGQLQVTDLNPP